MRIKSLIAILLGAGAVGLGIWRGTQGETAAAAIALLAGAFLVFRGLTNTVRPGC
ncbi:MAG: hypothetical protein GKS06_19485 [Acidobacteria bacterium]|nr:hypothetical protein [Acidobacteriota bacterium]